MTKKRNQKQAIRSRMAVTGEPYSVAARALRSLHVRPDVGLARRVPMTSLVPGIQLPPPWRPLLIRRDPASLVRHLTSYLKGWDAGRAAVAQHGADRHARQAHVMRRTGLRSDQREARSRRVAYQLEGADLVDVLPDAASASPPGWQTSRPYLPSNG